MTTYTITRGAYDSYEIVCQITTDADIQALYHTFDDEFGVEIHTKTAPVSVSESIWRRINHAAQVSGVLAKRGYGALSIAESFVLWLEKEHKIATSDYTEIWIGE